MSDRFQFIPVSQPSMVEKFAAVMGYEPADHRASIFDTTTGLQYTYDEDVTPEQAAWFVENYDSITMNENNPTLVMNGLDPSILDDPDNQHGRFEASRGYNAEVYVFDPANGGTLGGEVDIPLEMIDEYLQENPQEPTFFRASFRYNVFDYQGQTYATKDFNAKYTEDSHFIDTPGTFEMNYILRPIHTIESLEIRPEGDLEMLAQELPGARPAGSVVVTETIHNYEGVEPSPQHVPKERLDYIIGQLEKTGQAVPAVLSTNDVEVAVETDLAVDPSPLTGLSS